MPFKIVRKVINVGGDSLGVTIPKDILNQLKAKKGSMIILVIDKTA